MTLSTYSLLSIAEARQAVDLNGPNKDAVLETLALDASMAIEEWCDRKFVTRGTLTEYHTAQRRSDLYLLEWPIISCTFSTGGVWEDATRNYADTEKLTANTDYIAVLPKGKLTRVVDDGGIQVWEYGYRAIKVVYKAGYATTAAIPAGLKRVARELLGLLWRDQEHGERGIASRSDASGSVTRYVPAVVTEQMKRSLLAGGYRRLEWGRTGERDA